MIPKEIKILSLCFFIMFFAYNGVQQFLVTYFSTLNKVMVGFWSLTLIYFFLLISNFFSGFIVSKFGVKKCLVAGSLFYSLFIFSVVSKNLSFIYLASALLGFGAALLWTAQGTFLVRVSDPKRYGKNSGFFNTIFQLGSVFGIIIFSFIVVRLSFQHAFLIFAFLPLISTIIFTTLKNTKPKVVNFKEKFRAFGKMLTNLLLIKFFLTWISFSLVQGIVAGQIPLEIKKYFGLGSIGFLSSFFYFLPIAFSYYLGKLSDIKGRKNFLILAYILIALGLGLFAIQINFDLGKWIFVLFFLLISFGFAIFASIRFAIIGDVSKDSNLEYLTAISVLFGNMGYVIVFLLNIYLQPAVSYLISFCIVFLSLIISLPVLKLNTSTLKEKLSL